MTAKRTRGERAGLSRAQVLDAALALADREGLAALSMRRLGAELGVEAMTLYHYVPNKDAVLDGLIERVLSGTEAFANAGVPWPAALREYAESLRSGLLRHPGVLPLVLSRPAVTPQTLRTVELGLSVLCGAGFPLGRALDALNSVTLFVVAHTVAEVGIAPVDEAGGPGSAEFLAGLDPAELPLLSEAARTGQGTGDQHRFEFALSALISGFALTLPT